MLEKSVNYTILLRNPVTMVAAKELIFTRCTD